MNNLEKAQSLFFEKAPELFVDQKGLSPNELQVLFEKREQFLKSIDVEDYSKVLPTIVGSKALSAAQVVKSYCRQAWKGITEFSNTPATAIKTSLQQAALDNRALLQTVADFTSSFVFGGNSIDDYVGVKEGFHLGDLKFPENEKRAENVVTYISPERTQQLTQNPLVPVIQKDDKLILMGKDAVTNEPLLFSITVPNMAASKNEYNDTEIPLFLHIGGIEPKQMGRLSYKPQGGNHQQMAIDDKGRIITDHGVAVIEDFETQHVHYHPYTDTALINPRHYTCMINKDGNDYLPENATCQDAIVDMLDRFNILHPTPTPTTDRGQLDPTLLCGALQAIGASTGVDELDYLPVTVEMYDLLRETYEHQLETGETLEDNVDEIDSMVLDEIDLVESQSQEHNEAHIEHSEAYMDIIEKLNHTPTTEITPEQ